MKVIFHTYYLLPSPYPGPQVSGLANFAGQPPRHLMWAAVVKPTSLWQQLFSMVRPSVAKVANTNTGKAPSTATKQYIPHSFYIYTRPLCTWKSFQVKVRTKNGDLNSYHTATNLVCSAN